jgi:hypothetical protein
MKFSKQMNINGKWTTILLNDEEVDKTIEELLEKNYIQLKLCMQKVSELNVINEQKIQLAIALFDSSSIACYTMLGSKIDEKASEMRDGKYKARTETETFKKAQATAESKLKETPKIDGKSMVEKSFEEIE